MKLEFYSVSDDPRKAQKTIGNVIHTANNAAIYRECSLLTPEFLIDYSIAVSSCNYVYASIERNGESYSTYYFIKDRIVMPGGRMVVVCTEDVLSTWWHLLKNCTANVIRNEFSGIADIIDASMQANSRTCVYSHDAKDSVFTSRPTGHCYMLTVIGGSHTQEGVDSSD